MFIHLIFDEHMDIKDNANFCYFRDLISVIDFKNLFLTNENFRHVLYSIIILVFCDYIHLCIEVICIDLYLSPL